MRTSKSSLTLIRFALILSFLAAGMFSCSEEPLGYIYRPTQKDEVDLARHTERVVSSMYDHLDEVVTLLDEASHTTDYMAILPGGWQAVTEVVGGFRRNYLDRTYQMLIFDSNPMSGAIRTPSNIEYYYTSLINFENWRTGEFYTDIDEYMHLTVEYAEGRTDLKNVEGWFNIKRSIKFEEEVETEYGSYTWTYYQYPTWIIRIEDFSIDPYDQHARLVIEGTFPHLDEINQYREDHVSGEISISEDGVGVGEMYLYGEPAVRIYFTGRGAGFEGYFRLQSQDYSKIHKFED